MAGDVYRRITLDIGKAIKEKAPSPATALSRLKEMKEYVKQRIAASFRQLRSQAQSLTARHVRDLAHGAIRDTFLVFEEYVT